jgi:hypothetical protein
MFIPLKANNAGRKTQIVAIASANGRSALMRDAIAMYPMTLARVERVDQVDLGAHGR